MSMLELARYISENYEERKGKIVEVGIGNYWDVALELSKRGFDVVATDVKPVKVRSDRIKFFIDDVTNPNIEIYKLSRLIYSIRPPVELFEAIERVAEIVGADAIIKPLHNEFPDEKWRLVNFNGLSFYVLEVER